MPHYIPLHSIYAPIKTQGPGLPIALRYTDDAIILKAKARYWMTARKATPCAHKSRRIPRDFE